MPSFIEELLGFTDSPTSRARSPQELAQLGAANRALQESGAFGGEGGTLEELSGGQLSPVIADLVGRAPTTNEYDLGSADISLAGEAPKFGDEYDYLKEAGRGVSNDIRGGDVQRLEEARGGQPDASLEVDLMGQGVPTPTDPSLAVDTLGQDQAAQAREQARRLTLFTGLPATGADLPSPETPEAQARRLTQSTGTSVPDTDPQQSELRKVLIQQIMNNMTPWTGSPNTSPRTSR